MPLAWPNAFSTLCFWAASVQKGFCGLLWAPRETKRLQHRPIPHADLMLGIGVPWLQISHFCCNDRPYVSVTPLAGLKLGVFFCCVEDALENKSYQ